MNLTKNMEKILNDFAMETQKKLNNITEETAKKGVKELKKNSPKRRRKGKSYHKGWQYSKEKNKLNNVSVIIHNKSHYNLTHLLEKGHAIIRNGKSVGRAKAITHIKPVEIMIIDEFVKDLENEFEK